MMPMAPTMTLGDLLDSDRDLSTFNNLVRRSRLIRELDSKQLHTVFAPTNDAFDLLPKGSIGALVADKAKLERVISYHIAPGALQSDELALTDHVQTLYGSPVLIVNGDESSSIGGAVIEEADVPASNGVLYKIGQVMFPE